MLLSRHGKTPTKALALIYSERTIACSPIYVNIINEIPGPSSVSLRDGLIRFDLSSDLIAIDQLAPECIEKHFKTSHLMHLKS